MNKIKVLNLYACLGGNRLLWENCDVTAIELDEELAKLYQERFTYDKVIIADAHEYLLNHYKEFDFIWSSPPCPSHSRARFAAHGSANPTYPDLTLYQEIIFLDNYFKGKYCVENVIPYYEPLIAGQKRGRHIYWTNFLLPNIISKRNHSIFQKDNEVKKWCEFHNYDFYKYKGNQAINKVARNLVDYEAGLTIFNTAFNIIDNNKKQTQETLF